MAKKTASPHESSSEGNQIAITVTEKGPYLVTGNPPLAMQFIMPDSEGESWYFQEGRHFSTEKEPTALCRCGLSRSKPYCDGSHLKEEWDSAITSVEDRIMDEVEITEGQRVTLNDNEKYCVFARFCHPYGGVWDLTGLYRDRNAALMRFLLLEAAVLAAASAVTALLARRLTRPLAVLTDAGAQIAAGDYARRTDLHTGDEIEGSYLEPDEANGFACLNEIRCRKRPAEAVV